MHRISPTFEQRHEILVEHAYNEAAVAAVLLLLHFHMHLALRERCTVPGGHGLSQYGYEYLLVAGIAEIVVERAVAASAECRLFHVTLFGDDNVRCRSRFLERLYEKPPALFVHAVVLSYALRHPEEFHELCPVPESPALVYHIGSHFQQEPQIIILSPLYDHAVIAVTDPVRIVLAPQYQLLFGTYVLTRYAVEVEPVHERIFVYGYSPEKAPHDLFQLVLELHSIYEFRYPGYFLSVYRKVDVAVGYRLYAFADGIRHSPVHEYILIQVVQFAAQPHVSRPERTFPCAYIVYSPVHGLHQYLIIYRRHNLFGHSACLPFFSLPVCHKVSV